MTGIRQVAAYARVSSEDQAGRGTIQTQLAELDGWLARNPDVVLVERYLDDGVSGMLPLAERPAGLRLLRDAAAGRFAEILVYKYDRLGRDLVDLAVVRRRFDQLGIALTSVVEGQADLLAYDIQAAVADHGRREFLRHSAAGLTRAAREGRFTGGIVSYGYRVEGVKESARLVPDESVVWSDQTCADIVRQIYDWLAIEHWSCRRIASQLNVSGVPTHYARDERMVAPRPGERKARTQAVWRAGRIRNLVTNPVYRGELQYGRRSKKRDREVISAPVEALVSPAIWHAAQDVLAANRLVSKNTRRAYLLRSTLRCGIDGLTYVGSRGRDDVGWYRCTGQLVERGPIPGRCWGQSVRTDALEPAIWADIERWLRDPGDLLAELDSTAERGSHRLVVEAEAVTLGHRLDALEAQHKLAVKYAVQGVLKEPDIAPELERIAAERDAIEVRLEALRALEPEEPPAAAVNLLAEVRRRLDAGLPIEDRQEIVSLLVRATIYTETGADGRKRAWAAVTYRFPAVVETSTATGS